LGPEVGETIAAAARARGVSILTGASVRGLRGDGSGRVCAVVLGDGHELHCDSVCVGVGAVPAVEVAGGLTLAADGGIATDESLRTGIPGIYACGDVASAWRPRVGARLRVEHWTSAAAQGAAAARSLLGAPAPADDVPYFWSDVFGLRLQHVGHAGSWARVELEGDTESFTARYMGREGGLLAALLANRPEAAGDVRRELAAGARLAA
jgi:3-phenylpropionate/trans-cinnamate dioxygenase ferredoxin reductase subunit